MYPNCYSVSCGYAHGKLSNRQETRIIVLVKRMLSGNRSDLASAI